MHDTIELGCLKRVILLVTHRAELLVDSGECTSVEFVVDHEIADYIRGTVYSERFK